MTIDISATTGGQRLSRSRRSRASDIDTGDVTVRSRDFPRASSVRGEGEARGQMAVAQAIGSFFPVLSQAAAIASEAELEDIRRENEEEVARLESEVRQDRAGAREAIRTGDFSKFIPDSEMRQRRTITTAFKIVSARSMAHEDADKLRQKIQGTPLEGDPDSAVEDFLKANLKGADPFFAREYSREVARLAEKPLTDYRAARTELVQAQAERRGLELIRGQLAEGEIPTTVGGLSTMRRQMIGAIPTNAPDAVLRTDALVDNLLISLAAKGDTRALTLAQLPDPDRDGTSILSRNPGKLDKAISAWIKSKESVRSVEAHGDLEAFEDRLSLIEAGSPAKGDSVPSLWVDLWTHRETHGDSTRWDTLRDKIAGKLQADGVERGTWARVAAGQIPTVSNDEWNPMAVKLWDGTAIPELMRHGLSEPVARNRAFQVLANRGSGKRLRDTNSSRLLGSQREEEVRATFTTLRAVDIASDRPLQGNHLSDDAANLYHFMNWAQRSGRDPLAARAQYLAALDANEGQASPENHFEERLVRPGKGHNTVQGRGGVSKEARQLWRDLELPELSAPGFFSRITGGLISGDKPDFDELPAVAQARLERAINIASFMLSTSNASVDQIRALAGDMVKGEFGLELDANGNPAVTLDQTPPIAIGPDGTPVAGARVTADTLDRAREALKSPEAALVMAAIGGSGGVTQDPLTRAGYGLAVRSMAKGFPEDVVLSPDSRFAIPLSELPDDLPLSRFLIEVARDEKEDTVMFRVPAAPSNHPDSLTDRVHIADNLFFAFDERRGWTLRYRDMGPERTTLAELSAQNKEQRKGQPRTLGPIATSGLGARDVGEPSKRGRTNVSIPLPQGRTRVSIPLAPVGSPVPRGNDRGPLTDEEASGVAESEAEAMAELVARGVVHPDAALTADDAANMTEKTRAALLKTRTDGGWLDDITKLVNRRFLSVVASMIEEHEGRTAFAHDDQTGRRWKPGSPGNPTVGVGFNLNRPDARELIEAVGADFAKVKAVTTGLTRPQQDRLLALTIQKTATWLRDHFAGVDMANHRWMALLSLAYNSRWTDRGPTLVGPRLTKAIKEGQWDAAAREIETSTGGAPKHLAKGIAARRKREAALFRGTFAN